MLTNGRPYSNPAASASPPPRFKILLLFIWGYELMSDCKTRCCNRDVMQIAIHSNSILQQTGLVWINSIELIRWINSELIQDFFTWIIPIIPRKIHMRVYCNGCKEFVGDASFRCVVLPLNDSTPLSTSRPVGWVILSGCCRPELLLDKLLSFWRSSSGVMLHCRKHWIHPTPQS